MVKKIKKIFTRNNDQLPLVLIFALVILFWAIFDGAISYILPLLIREQGFSNSEIGLIIGFSSVAGALFDFFIYKIFKNTNFRRLILAMFIICFAYPLLLWQTKSIWLFLLAMSVWGVYYDLYGFGVFNFVAKYIKRKNTSSSFGVIQVFKSLGNIIGPLIVGFVIVGSVDWRSLAISWVALVIGFIFFIYLFFMIRGHGVISNLFKQPLIHRDIFAQYRVWRKLGGLLRPVLAISFYYRVIDAFFWTLIPLYAVSTNYQQLGGLLLAAYSVPALIAGWFVGALTNKYGKKRTAYSSLLVGSLILVLFFFIHNEIILVLSIFLASFFIKLTRPVTFSSFADYINDAPLVEIEIEGLEDFSANMGYIFGPILAGILADLFGIQSAFGVLGLVGAGLAVILLIYGPKHIIINNQSAEII